MIGLPEQDEMFSLERAVIPLRRGSLALGGPPRKANGVPLESNRALWGEPRINATRWQTNEKQNTNELAELQLRSVSPPGSWQRHLGERALTN